MVTLQHIQAALAKRRVEASLESTMVGIACFTLDRESIASLAEGTIEERVRAHGGVLTRGPGSCQIAVFPGLIDAADCMRALRDRFGVALRAGVNL